MSFTIFQYNKMPFQAIITGSSKSRKIDLFPKGLIHGFGPKIVIFPSFFFLTRQARKMSPTIFQNEKTPFQALKTRMSKSRKIDIFSKGLTHRFGPKMAIFPTFFYTLQANKMSFTIFQNEKTAFQAMITRRSKSRKIDLFPKGLTLGFGPKMVIFPCCFFQAIQARKMSFTILQNQKTPFQAIKTRSSKRREIDSFPKGLTHVFGHKMAIFPTFFCRQYRPGKCLLRYSKTKKGLSRL